MDSTPRPQHILYGLCLLLAPLLLAAATLFWQGDTTGLTGGVLTVYSFTCWIGVFIAFETRLRPHFPRLALAAVAGGVLGGVAGTNFGVQGIYRAILDTSVAVDALAPAEMAAAVAVFYLPGILFPLILLFFGGLLLRAKVVPAWCGILICLGAVAFPVSRIPRIQWIALMADLTLMAPLLWMSWQHFRRGVGRAVLDSTAAPTAMSRE